MKHSDFSLQNLFNRKKKFCQFVLERSKNMPKDNWKSSQKLLRAIKLIFRYMDMLLLKEICDDRYGNKKHHDIAVQRMKFILK